MGLGEMGNRDPVEGEKAGPSCNYLVRQDGREIDGWVMAASLWLVLRENYCRSTATAVTLKPGCQ